MGLLREWGYTVPTVKGISMDDNYLFLNLREVSPNKAEVMCVVELLRQIHAEDFEKWGNVDIQIVELPKSDNYQEVEYHLRIYFGRELEPASTRLEIYYKLIGTCFGCVRTLRNVEEWFKMIFTPGEMK